MWCYVYMCYVDKLCFVDKLCYVDKLCRKASLHSVSVIVEDSIWTKHENPWKLLSSVPWFPQGTVPDGPGHLFVMFLVAFVQVLPHNAPLFVNSQKLSFLYFKFRVSLQLIGPQLGSKTSLRPMYKIWRNDPCQIRIKQDCARSE